MLQIEAVLFIAVALQIYATCTNSFFLLAFGFPLRYYHNYFTSYVHRHMLKLYTKALYLSSVLKPAYRRYSTFMIIH